MDILFLTFKIALSVVLLANMYFVVGGIIAVVARRLAGDYKHETSVVYLWPVMAGAFVLAIDNWLSSE